MTELEKLIRKIQQSDLSDGQKCIFELIDQVDFCTDSKICDVCQVALINLRERLLKEFTGVSDVQRTD